MISFFGLRYSLPAKLPLSMCGRHSNSKYPQITIALHYLFIIYDKPEKSPALPHIQIFSPKYRYRLLLLDHSVSFQKDLERGRCSPSIEGFYHICRMLDISADDCIFQDGADRTGSTYQALLWLLQLSL